MCFVVCDSFEMHAGSVVRLCANPVGIRACHESGKFQSTLDSLTITQGKMNGMRNLRMVF